MSDLEKQDLKNKKVIGIDTNSAVRSGFFWGYAGLIDNIINLIKKEQENLIRLLLQVAFLIYLKIQLKQKLLKTKISLLRVL